MSVHFCMPFFISQISRSVIMAKITLAQLKEKLAELQKRFAELTAIQSPTADEKKELESIAGEIEVTEKKITELEPAPAKSKSEKAYEVDEQLSKSSDAKELDSLSGAFTKAAKKFPGEAVTILSFKKTVESVIVVLNAEKKGMRKVVIQS